METAKHAAQYLRMIWQGHDERSEKICEDGAFGLYNILAPAASDYSKKEAAKLVREAFWAADKAEEFQAQNELEENLMYKNAEECLNKSRSIVGLETQSVQFTIVWWKAYRHKDKEALLENLVKEHLCQVTGNNSSDVAKKCSYIILEAAAEHKKRDWKAVDNKLTEYFEIYLSNLPKE